MDRTIRTCRLPAVAILLIALTPAVVKSEDAVSQDAAERIAQKTDVGMEQVFPER